MSLETSLNFSISSPREISAADVEKVFAFPLFSFQNDSWTFFLLEHSESPNAWFSVL